MCIFVVKFITFVKYYFPFVKYRGTLKKIFTLALVLIAPLISAKTYYVAATGGSDLFPGTLTQPWSTWQKAFNTARAGDTVFIRGGVYYPTKTQVIVPRDGSGYSGTSDYFIHYIAYPPDWQAGNVPILDGRNIVPDDPGESTGYNAGIYIDGANYLHFEGLTIRNYWQKYLRVFVQGLVSVDCKFHTYKNITVHNITGRGIYYDPTLGPDTTCFINCDVYNCCDSLAAPGEEGGWGDGWQAINQKAAYLLFDGCRAWNNSDDGFNTTPLGLIEIRNCWSFDNGKLNGDGTGYKMNPDPDQYNSETTYRVHNNISAFNKIGFDENNNGMATEESRIYNNTSYNNKFWGFVNHGNNIGIQKNNVYRNNVSFLNGLAEISEYLFYTDDHNSWNVELGVTVSNADFVLTNKSLSLQELTAPRKLDGSLPDISFLKLVEGSDLIDVGINVGLSFSGTGPDLGYSEYNSVAVDPSPPIFVGAVIENTTPARLEMTFNQTLANIVPATSAFAVKVNSVTRTVSSIAISGTKVLLTLTSPVIYGDIVTVAYVKPATNPLQNPAGGQASSLAAQSVTNNCTSAANQAPLVTITSPTKNLTFIAPATITIEATAMDPDGLVIKVEFYAGDIKLAEAPSNPFNCVWKDVVEGIYIIYAVATDNLGAKTVSETVTVLVEKAAQIANELPVVDVTYYPQGKSKKPKKHDNIVLVAAAYDPDGTILNVEFKNRDTSLALVNSAPFEYTLQNVDTGTYIITAIATDNRNASISSMPIKIFIGDLSIYEDIFKLSPNPNHGQFAIDIYSEIPGFGKKIIITNLLGETIFEDKLADFETHRELDLSHEVAGTYILMISSENRIISAKKFIKR